MASNFVVGITGGSGSGKTSFVKALNSRLSEICTVISQDDYYLPLDQQPVDEKGIHNFDMPCSIDSAQMVADVKCLLQGKSIQRKEYMFETSYQENEGEQDAIREGEMQTFEPKPILVIEGLFCMHEVDLMALMDMRVFISASEVSMLTRRIKRDRIERALPLEDVLYRYEAHVLPAYRKYIEPHKADADIVINNNSDFEIGLAMLVSYLSQKV